MLGQLGPLDISFFFAVWERPPFFSITRLFFFFLSFYFQHQHKLSLGGPFRLWRAFIEIWNYICLSHLSGFPRSIYLLYLLESWPTTMKTFFRVHSSIHISWSPKIIICLATSLFFVNHNILALSPYHHQFFWLFIPIISLISRITKSTIFKGSAILQEYHTAGAVSIDPHKPSALCQRSATVTPLHPHIRITYINVVSHM